MSITVTPNITPNAVPNATSSMEGIDKAEGSSGGFSALVKGIGQEAMETSKAADQASTAAINGNISDLELVQVMTEAEISLQRFKTVYETTKQSLDKILNMGI